MSRRLQWIFISQRPAAIPVILPVPARIGAMTDAAREHIPSSELE
jgi:hypothetical protein